MYMWIRANLYISEFCNIQEAWSSLSEQKQTFLSEGYFSNTMRGLNAGWQLVHTFTVVEFADDFRREIYILCFGLCLFPEGVKHSENFWIHLIMLSWNRESSEAL